MRAWRSAVRTVVATALLVAGGALLVAGAESDGLRVGFGHTDITPVIKPGSPPIWIAGYGQGRRATGVHDRLFCRCVVLENNGEKVALASVDLIGLQYPVVKRIREKLADFRHVLVASTHNHEGPDVIGIWGPHALASGVNAAYLDLVVERVVAAIRQADTTLETAKASFGSHRDDALVDDSRLPRVLDSVLRVVRFDSLKTGEPAGLVVQFSCHPESLGRNNTLLTCDFPYATVAALEKRYRCPVVYFSGAVGGLMGNPSQWKRGDTTFREGTFDFAEVYGEAVAQGFEKACDKAESISMTPFTISAKPIAAPLENKLYQLARGMGVLAREGFVWTGDSETLGASDRGGDPQVKSAVETEVGYLAFGELHIAAIPGEIYPELVYGAFQEPAAEGVDFPQAALENNVEQIMRSKKWMLFGLANDEIGYIIPKRQWDARPPYAYGRKESQYGEVNSCGAEIAPLIMQALERRSLEVQAMKK